MNLKQALLVALEAEQLKDLCNELELDADRRSPRAMLDGSDVREFFDRCTDRFLGTLPSTVRVVVFLGLDAEYVDALYQRVRELHPSVRRASPLVYKTPTVTFAHVIHPSPLATSHRQKWLRNDDSSLAEKRREVAAALGFADYSPRENVTPPAVKAKDPVPKRVVGDSPQRPQSDAAGLVEMIRNAIASGELDAVEVPNMRAGKDDVDKLLRLRRRDFQEFAIDRQSSDILVWSSVPPSGAAELRKEYLPHETRSSNLNVMEKLRGPDKKGRFGTHVWRLRFRTPTDLLTFIDGH